jgi:hypothetical protein
MVFDEIDDEMEWRQQSDHVQDMGKPCDVCVRVTHEDVDGFIWS